MTTVHDFRCEVRKKLGIGAEKLVSLVIGTEVLQPDDAQLLRWCEDSATAAQRPPVAEDGGFIEVLAIVRSLAVSRHIYIRHGRDQQEPELRPADTKQVILDPTQTLKAQLPEFVPADGLNYHWARKRGIRRGVRGRCDSDSEEDSCTMKKDRKGRSREPHLDADLFLLTGDAPRYLPASSDQLQDLRSCLDMSAEEALGGCDAALVVVLR